MFGAWKTFLQRRALGTVNLGIIAATSVSLAALAGMALAAEGEGASSMGASAVILPLPDALRGQKTFVAKGCVICHSVNGVGGRAAPALDADPDNSSQVDLLGFVARMWRGAPAMLELQAIELGYQIELSGQEIADLAAFSSDALVQEGFSMDAIPEPMQTWMLNEPYWEDGDWPEEFQEYPDLEEFFDSEKGHPL